jgi:hypothetical protein
LYYLFGEWQQTAGQQEEWRKSEKLKVVSA